MAAPLGTGASDPDAQFLYFRNFVDALAAPIAREVLQEQVERLFHRICVQLQPTASIEIGAHDARFSRRIKRTLPETRALAFEANPYVYDRHVKRTTGAGVEYLPMAVGPTNGKVELTIPTSVRHAERPLTNRMASLGQHLQADDAQTVEVDCVRLDDFLTRTPEDRFVAWIDVEGASEVVLESSREVLKQTSAIYIEVEREARWEAQWLDVDVARFLMGAGFLPIARDTQRPHQYNLIFVDAKLATDPQIARLVATRYRRRTKKAGAAKM